MKRTVQRLAMASVLGLTGAPVAAGDLIFNAYIGIPLGGGSPFAGVGTRQNIGSFSHDSYGSPQPSQVKLDLRFSPKGGTVLSLNDIALTQTPYASHNGATESGQGYTHWQIALGAALGVGLIVAIAESDSSVKICSGTNCPPEEDPPAEPEAANTGGDTEVLQ